MLLATCLRRSAISSFAFSNFWISIFSKLALLLLILFCSAHAKAASCSYTNFAIGLELSADAGPDASGQFHYQGTSIRCSSTGVVIYDSGTGFPDPYDFGWMLPDNLVSTVRNTFGPAYASGRFFVNGCKSHLIVVSQYYPSTQFINGVSMAVYPPSATATYSDGAFGANPVLYVPLLAGGPRWDYMAQNDQCKAPPDYAPGPNCAGSCDGNGTNPINTGWYGTKFQTERDFMGEGSYPLHFERYYVSRKQAIPGQATPINQPVAAWGHTYANKIVLSGAKSSNLDTNPRIFALAYRPDGRIYIFDKSGTNWVSSLPDVTHQLKQFTDGSWQFITNDDETETYDVSGKLVSIRNRTGITHSLTYTAAGITVTDSFGHTLNIGLLPSKLVSSLTTPKGEVYNYAVNGNMYTSVTYPDTKIRSYEYSTGQYLSGIVDENNVRIAAWSYDSSFRAYSSEHGGGTDKFTIAYSSPLSTNSSGAPVVITDPRGVARTYTYTHGNSGSASGGQRSGIVKQTSSTQPCDACTNGHIASTTYDANDFVASKTDFNGNVTIYVHDTRGMETSRTEASGTPQARTITTQYHPTFRLPTKITEPGRVTDFVYHSTQGGLLTKTITDTATNKSRVWTYTYNAYGQVLTADAPRTDVVDTVTYTYDAEGNVASKTNILGHITLYTAYDANGRLLSMTDPNGLVTTMTYDPRGRMLTRQVGAELTQFIYDPAGNLTKTIAPDATATNYTYD